MRMVRSRAVNFLALIALSTTLVPYVLAQQPGIHVGPNVQVSVANSKLNHGEVLMGADPNNPNNLVGCSMIFPDPLTRRLSDGVTYTSNDGGAHWSQTLYVNKGTLGSDGDPACGFGPKSEAFSVYLEPAVKIDEDDVLVFKSTDAGRNWLQPTHIDWIDREYITVDSTGGKYNGYIYVNGTGVGRPMQPSADLLAGDETAISIQRSSDGGKTFRPPIKRFSQAGRWVLGMGNGVVLSDGTYVAIFGEQTSHSRIAERRPGTPNAYLKVISSTDGGASFENATVVSDWHMDYGDIGSDGSIVPVIAVDRSSGPFKDRLYAVWPDYRSGRGQVFCSFSTNKGKSWSQPIIVDDDRTWTGSLKGPDDNMPVVDVNREGIVGISWYDRRDNPNNLGWYIRFSASTDGGETFSPSVRVSEAPATINLKGNVPIGGSSYGGGKTPVRDKGGPLTARFGYGTIFSFNGGHTAGMSADAGGRFHPFWIDNRTGVEQVWSAAISVDGGAFKDGSKELSGMEDVTKQVTLDLKNGTYDKASSTVTIDAYLANTSDKPITGPIKLRVLNLQSKMGTPSISDSDNGQSGSGAVLDFSSVIPNSSLAPGERSGPKHLTFHLAGVEWGETTPPSAADLHSFIDFGAKVFASAPAPNK